MARIARYMMRDKNPVSNLVAFDTLPDFLDYTCDLVSENSWCLFYPVPLHNIAATYTGGFYTDKYLSVTHFRYRLLLYPDIIIVVINRNAQFGNSPYD
jgi:hypothetical protein